jgi:hypothetical protein
MEVLKLKPLDRYVKFARCTLPRGVNTQGSDPQQLCKLGQIVVEAQ